MSKARDVRRGVALIYIRQSRTEQADGRTYAKTVSLETQEKACRELPVVTSCEEVVVFRDRDISGGKLDGREGMKALLARIEASRVDDGDVAAVVAYDQSRTFRNTAHALAFFALMERKPWIQVAFVHGSFERTPVGEFSYSVLAAAHAMERRMVGAKVRASYRFRNEQGQATGMAPYGYRRGKDGNFAIDEDEAAVVQRMFKEYSTGQRSTAVLAARLNSEGIIKPGSRSGGLGWVPDTIVDILKNSAYIGKTYSISRARREGDLIPATWEPIVDPLLFQSVQRALKGNRRTGRAGTRPTHLVFSRLLICGRCGRRLRAKTNRHRVYYFCRQDVARDRECQEARRFIREDQLLPWAENLFRRLDALRPEGFDEAKSAGRPVKQSPAALKQIDASLEKTRKLFLWGHIDEAEYHREHSRLSELRADLEQASRPRATITLSGLSEAWLRGSGAQRREMLAALFDGLIIKGGSIIEYVPRTDRVAEVVSIMERAFADGSQWREGRDSNRPLGTYRLRIG